MRSATQWALLGAALLAAAACGGGKSGGSAVPAATGRSPDATVSLTIIPSTNVGHAAQTRGRSPHAAQARGRSPQFLDPLSTATLSFQIYSSRSDGTQLSTTLDNVPVTGATTKVNIPAYSGVVFLFAQEYDPQGNTLAVNYVSYGVTLDPGTSEPLSVTLQLVPASVALTTTPDLSSATDANKACITVNAQKRSQLFALVPVDADGTYQKAQSAGPNGLGYGVTLSGITNGSDGNGGTSTIVAQSQTWNGYQVYNFVYTPAAGNTSTTPAPAVSATATTPDPRDPQGTGFTESVKIQPGNCTTSSS